MYYLYFLREKFEKRAFEILNITAVEAKLSPQSALNPINHDEREILEPEAK